MVPDAFVRLDAMPQLPNGKMNRRALLEASPGELQQSVAYEPPATETEHTLAKIWADVIEVPVEHIGRQTRFFDIGGHSLSAMRVLARIKDAFCVEIGLAQLFDEPQLQSIAAAVDREIAEQPASERAAPRGTARAKPRSGTGL